MAKQPDYRLQALLDIRARKKEDAEHALASAMAAHKAEAERQRQMEVELERMIAKREQRKRDYSEKAMRGEMSAQDVVSANSFIDRLKESERAQQSAIDGQKMVVAQKDAEVQDARQAVVLATQELKALEKHKEKFLDDWKKELQAKEEASMDEVAQQIFLSQGR